MVQIFRIFKIVGDISIKDKTAYMLDFEVSQT